MAAPAERGSTAPVAGLSTTSPAGTQVGDLVIVSTFEYLSATDATHTLQSGFTFIGTNTIPEAGSLARLSVAYKIATSSGANSYQAFTSSIGTTTWTGCYVFQTGTFDTNAIGLAPTDSSGTGTGAPNPAAIKLPLFTDCTVVVIGCWRLSATASTTPVAGANYTLKTSVAASATGEMALATRAITSPAGATEDPAIFTDNVTPTGNCAMTFWVAAPISVIEAFNIDSFGTSSDGTSFSTILGNRPAANSLLVATAVASQASGADPPTVSSMTGYGLTWELVELDKFDSTGTTFTMEVWAAKVGATPVSGNLTAAYTGTSTSGELIVDNFTGLTLGSTAVASFIQKGANGQGTSTSGSATLSALASSSNVAFTAVSHAANEVITVGGSFKGLADVHSTTPPFDLATEWATNQTTCNASWTTSSDYYFWAGEIAKVPATATPQSVPATTTLSVALAANKLKKQAIDAATTVTAAIATKVVKLKAIPASLTVTADVLAEAQYGVLTYENSAEGGSDTTAVTTGNSGGTSGRAWNTVNNGTTGVTAYDASPSIEGLSVAYTGGGSASINYLGWTGISVLSLYARVYVYLVATPGSAYRLLNLMNGSTVGYDIRMQGANGKFGLYANNVLVDSASQTPNTGQWIRLELHAVANTGACEARIFYSPNSTTPDETLTGTGATQSGLTAIRFGVPTSQTFSDFNMDEFAVTTVDWLGPGASVPGGMTPQSIAAATTVGAALIRSMRKPVPASATSTMGMTRRSTRFIPAGVTPTAALTRRSTRAIPAGSVVVAALARRASRIIPAATTIAAALARRVGRTVAATMSATLVLLRRIPQRVNATSALSAALDAVFQSGAEVVQQAVDVATSLAVSITRRSTETLAAAMTAVLGLAKRPGKPVPATASIVASLSRRVARTVAAATTLVVSLPRRVGKLVAAATTTTTVLTRVPVKLIAPALGLGVAVLKRTTKFLAIVITNVVGLTFVRAVRQAVATTTTVVVAVGRRAGKLVAAGASMTVVLTRRMSEAIGVVVTNTIALARLKVATQLIAATVAITTVLTKLPRKLVTVTSALVVGLGKRIPLAIAGVFTNTIALLSTKVVVKVIAAATALTAAAVRRVGKVVPVGLTMTVVLARIKVALQAIAVTMGMGVSVLRRLPKLIATGITNTIGIATRRTIKQVVVVTASLVVALSRKVGKPVAILGSLVVSITRRMYETVVASMTLTVAIGGIKTLMRSIAAGVTMTVGLARSTGKLVAITITATIVVGVTKALHWTIAVGTSIGVAVTRRMSRVVAATTAIGVALFRRIPQRIAASTAFTATLAQLKVFTRAISVALSLGVGLTRRVVKQVAATATHTVALSLRKTVVQGVAVVATITVGIARRITHLVATGVSLSVGVLRRIPQRVAVSTPVTAALGAIKTFTRIIAAGVSFAVVVGRRAAKLVAAAVTVGVSLGLRKALSQAIEIAVTIEAGMAARLGKVIAVTVPVVVETSRRIGRVISVGVSFTVTAVAAARRFVSMAIGLGMNALLEAHKRLGVIYFQVIEITTTFAVGLSRVVGKLVAATVGLIALMARRTINRIWPADANSEWPEAEPPEDPVNAGWPAKGIRRR